MNTKEEFFLLENILGENIQVHMYFVVKLHMADSGCLGDEQR